MLPLYDELHAEAAGKGVLMSLYFSPKGRISRKVYWLGSLPLFALAFFSELLAGEGTPDAAIISSFVLLAVIIPSLMLSIKRCHDRNKTGWFVLVSFIPFIGPLWLLVELGLLRGTEGHNAYGPDPLLTTPNHDTIFAEVP